MSAGAVEKLLYDTLSGDTQLATLAPAGVWRDVVPQTAPAGTAIIFTQLEARDTYTLAVRALTDFVFQVKAVAQGESGAPAWDASARVETLLTDKPLSLDGGRVLMCRRQTVISETEVDGGEVFQHAGGLYAITIQE